MARVAIYFILGLFHAAIGLGVFIGALKQLPDLGGPEAMLVTFYSIFALSTAAALIVSAYRD